MVSSISDSLLPYPCPSYRSPLQHLILSSRQKWRAHYLDYKLLKKVLKGKKNKNENKAKKKPPDAQALEKQKSASGGYDTKVKEDTSLLSSSAKANRSENNLGGLNPKSSNRSWLDLKSLRQHRRREQGRRGGGPARVDLLEDAPVGLPGALAHDPF